MEFNTPDKTTKIVRELISRHSKSIKMAVDMTCGNGFDSLYILETIPEVELISLDIQEIACDNTKALLESNFPSKNWSVICTDHSRIVDYLSSNADLFIYNLGYLPGGNKQIVTTAESTVKSLRTVIEQSLNPGGLVLITVYRGHKGGEDEFEAICTYLRQLSQKEYNVLKFDFLNQINNPPLVISIEKGACK